MPAGRSQSSFSATLGLTPFVLQAYNKNLRVQFGRCPVRSVFDEALKILQAKQDVLGFMEDNIMPLASAPEGFQLFDRRDVYKVILEVSG